MESFCGSAALCQRGLSSAIAQLVEWVEDDDGFAASSSRQFFN